MSRLYGTVYILFIFGKMIKVQFGGWSQCLYDIFNRTYHYPLEYIIEALAPTTENDFDQLPEGRQEIYCQLQSMHIHGSPDGPWFFIIARNDFYQNQFQLIGITDTAMLRPQVFAFHDGEVQVGLICSEKQAIDATLASLAVEDHRICPVADKYWNAVGSMIVIGFLGSFALWLLLIIDESLWPIPVVGTIVLVGVGVPLWSRWLAKRTVYTCARCGHQFQISAWRTAFCPGAGLAAYTRNAAGSPGVR